MSGVPGRWGGGGGRGTPGGRCAACPGVGSGLMADAGDNGSPAPLSATAALCVWAAAATRLGFKPLH